MYILLGVIVILIAFQCRIRRENSAEVLPLDTTYASAIKEWEQAQLLNNHTDHFSSQSSEKIRISIEIDKLSPFNPNLDNYEELVNKGVPSKIASNIVNYRNKGGKFFNKGDLKKLYAINDSLYALVENYITIEHVSNKTYYDNKNEKAKYYESNYKSDTKGYYKTNLNTADTTALMKLKGIGSTFANRIIKYRDLLGGFFEVNQLKEVYGFPDSTFEALKPYWIINHKDIKQIDINSASYETFAKHPYIGKQMASEIIKVRKDIGHFKDYDNLTLIPLLNGEKYRKIAPYIKVASN